MHRAMLGTIRFKSSSTSPIPENVESIETETTRPSFMVGLDVFLDIKNGGDVIKTRCNVVGWVADDYILVTAPVASRQLVDLQPGESVVMRYLLDGIVYGFSSTLVRRIISPSHLWAVQYPRTIEWRCLRQHARLHALIPAVVNDQQQARDALILDISEGGALLSLREGAEPVAMGEMVKLRFQLPNGQEVDDLEAKVRNLHMTSRIGQVGVQFSPDGEAYERVVAFVREVPQNLGLSEKDLVNDF